MATPSSPPRRPSGALPERRLERPRDGRLLAGVCAALARYSGRGAGTIRLAFILTIPLFGLPLVAYLALWVILPAEGDRERSRGSVLFSGFASILLGFGALIVLLTLALASTLATIFGLGWGVVVVAAAVLAAGLVWLREVNPGWMLLPLAALVLPAAVVTGLHAHLERQIGNVDFAPTSRSELPADGYRTGIGTLFVDLRHYDWSNGSTTPLKLEGGLGRTIVALPANRCVAVRVHYDSHDELLRGLARALGVEGVESSGAVIFGHMFFGGGGVFAPKARRGVPTLTIDSSSQGGELFVRDYPASIDPREDPYWPGVPYPGYALDPSSSKKEVRRQQRLNRRIRQRLPGPCSTGVGR